MLAIAIAFLLYLSFFCIGIRFIYKTYQPFKENWDARHWDKVKGEIVEVKADYIWQPLDEPIGDIKEIQLAYEFEYRGIKYRKDKLSLDNDIIHSNKSKKQTGFFVKNINTFLDKVRLDPKLSVWVQPNNPHVTIIRNVWRKHLAQLLVGMTLIIWGLCMTKIFASAELDIGSIKLEDKIEVLERLAPEEIKKIQAAEDAKEAENTRKGIEANLKWRKEQGLPID